MVRPSRNASHCSLAFSLPTGAAGKGKQRVDSGYLTGPNRRVPRVIFPSLGLLVGSRRAEAQTDGGLVTAQLGSVQLGAA